MLCESTLEKSHLTSRLVEAEVRRDGWGGQGISIYALVETGSLPGAWYRTWEEHKLERDGGMCGIRSDHVVSLQLLENGGGCRLAPSRLGTI